MANKFNSKSTSNTDQTATKVKLNQIPRLSENGDTINVKIGKQLKSLVYYEIKPQILQNLDVDELVDQFDRIADLFNKMPIAHFQLYVKKTQANHKKYIDDLNEKKMTEDSIILSKILGEEAEYVAKQTEKTQLKRFIFIVEIDQWANEDTIKQMEQEMQFLGVRKLRIDEVKYLFVQKVYGVENVDYEEVFYAKIKHQRKYFKSWVDVGNFSHQTYAISKYPRVKDTFFIVDIFNTFGNFDVIYDFQKTQKHKIIQKLDGMYINKENASVKGKPSDRAKAQKELESAENMIVTIASELEEVWQFNMIIDIYDNDITGITKTVNSLKSTFLTNGMQANQILTGLDAFFSSLPICSVEKSIISQHSHHMHSHALAMLFPAFTNDYSEEKGIIVGINEQTGNVVIIDPQNHDIYSTRNKIAFGLSGRGKTFAMETDIVRNVAQGAKVIVLTPDRGYNFNDSIAQVVKFGISYKNAINPFKIDSLIVDSDDKKDVVGGELYWLKKVSDVLNFLRTITEISNIEIGLIEDIIAKLYEQHGYTKESYTIPATVPVLSDLYNEALKQEDLRDFCSRIKPFAIGTYSHIFSQNRKWDYEKPITVLDIKGLDEKLRPTIMDALIKSIWEFVKVYDEKVIIYIDEVHQLTHSVDSIQFIVDLAKRIRKYGDDKDGAVFITQNPSDLLKHEGTENIASNCDFVMLFPIKSEDINELKKISFTPTREQQKFLTSAKKHRAVFKAGETSVTVKIVRLDAEWGAFA